MFEFLDESGEVMTVRSARSLDLLLAKRIIVASTPFRKAGDTRFEPASASPILQGIAAEQGLGWVAASASIEVESGQVRQLPGTGTQGERAQPLVPDSPATGRPTGDGRSRAYGTQRGSDANYRWDTARHAAKGSPWEVTQPSPVPTQAISRKSPLAVAPLRPSPAISAASRASTPRPAGYTRAAGFAYRAGRWLAPLIRRRKLVAALAGMLAVAPLRPSPAISVASRASAPRPAIYTTAAGLAYRAGRWLAPLIRRSKLAAVLAGMLAVAPLRPATAIPAESRPSAPGPAGHKNPAGLAYRAGRWLAPLIRRRKLAAALACILALSHLLGVYFHEVIASEYPATRPVFKATRLMPHMTEEGFTLRSGLRTEPDIRALDPANLPPSIVVSGEIVNTSWVPRSVTTLQVRVFDIRGNEIARKDVSTSRRWIWPGDGAVFRADVPIGGVRPAEVILKLGQFE